MTLRTLEQFATYNHFQRAGYLKLTDAVPNSLVESMCDVITQGFNLRQPPYRIGPTGDMLRLDGLIKRHPVFLDALRSTIMATALETMLGPNVVLLTNRHNHAALNRKGDIPFRLHRDILQWSRATITLIIYLEDASVERGCTHIVPGSHVEPFAGMAPDGGGGNWADDHSEYSHLLEQAIPVPVARGDALIINALTFHSVGQNFTEQSRMSCTFALRSVDELDSRPSNAHHLLLGRQLYKGNDLDHNTVIPAYNKHQAPTDGIDYPN